MMVNPKELDGPLLQPGPAYGDTICGMNIAGGIAAALFHRERTGEATEVDVSLLSSGIWATACSIDVAMEMPDEPDLFRAVMPGSGSGNGTNPFIVAFRTADDKFINLTVLSPGPYLEDVFGHLHISAIANVPPISPARAILDNTSAASMVVRQAIAAKPYSSWRERLNSMRG